MSSVPFIFIGQPLDDYALDRYTAPYELYSLSPCGRAVFRELVVQHGARPRYRQSLGHTHTSQLLSVGTVDTSVSREILDFIDRIRRLSVRP